MRTREEQIKPWGYISPFAKKSLQDREKCDLTITRKSTVSTTMPLYTEEHILEAERRAEQQVRAEIEASLKDPTTVHVNMLRGSIATPGWEQFLHLFPKERAEIGRDSERLDWLEQKFRSCTVYMNGEQMFMPGPKVRNLKGRNFREAIDKARENAND